MQEKLDEQNVHIEKYQPFPFYKLENGNDDNSRVYGQLYIEEDTIWDEGESRRIRVSASLVNRKMLNMEYEAREEGECPLFFYEFTGEMELKRWQSEGRLDCQDCNYTNMEGYYAFKIHEIREEGEAARILQEHRSNRCFVGDLIFSASPILSAKAVLVVEETDDSLDKDAIKKLIATYNSWDKAIKSNSRCIYDKTKILEILSIYWDDEYCEKVSIYNVGQANCCYCKMTKSSFFFDIGVTKSGEDREDVSIKKAIDEIGLLDSDGVVLSHWDLDHILGVCYNSKCLHSKLWIVPDFEKLYKRPRVSIKRLCNYLLRNGNSTILMIDTTDINKEFYKSNINKIFLYLGEPKSANGINKMNNGGLILRLENTKNILLPGDCENSIIPSKAVAVPYNYVMIPHHGSVMSDPTVIAKPYTSAAYYSCGNVTGNCNIDVAIVDKYKEKGFSEVHCTRKLKKNYKFFVNL